MSIPLSAGATLHPLAVPARADAADAGEFRELARVRNLVYRELTGRDEQDLSPSELLPRLRSREEQKTLVWAVRLSDEMIGRAMVDLPLEEGSRVATATIELRPHAWGRGIGRAILPHIEDAARSHGRSVIQNSTEQPATDGVQLPSPTGYGSVPDDHVARFLTRSGFSLEQVYRISLLELDAPARARRVDLSAEAQAASSDYRIVTWTLPTPDAHVDGYAWLKSRMSTDAPSADLDTDEEAWDAARVRRMEQRQAEAGHTLQVTAALHIRTGELAAFTELGTGTGGSTTTIQHDTLVLREHRGHRLGLRVKCAALAAWNDVAPSSTRVITYNAEENRPMLDINEAMGFTACAYEGVWKKELT
ncbi:GNAT family N-acetyltransferase [Microbacterium sp. NPDC008134]|uniref:GNAT family N-acetyltransferase n=1 Tax=Microbacterium sp. NPDC008134 TaxID=3364183 RepID=UPI0036E013D4